MSDQPRNPDLPVIGFTRSPAWVTLGEGLSLAGRYWAASWSRWVLAVIAVALADGLATWLIGSTLLDQQAMARLMLPGAEVDPAVVPRLLAGPLAVAIVSLVADWFLYANAVAGLRGREVTLAWVLRAGLRVLLALLAVSLAFSTVLLLLALLGPIGLVAMLLLLPVIIFVAIRLTFWVVAVFDGQGIEASLRTSWALTQGAMLRVVGWSLALIGLSLLISIASAIVSAGFAILPILPAVVGSLVTTMFQAFTVIAMAILYESQRQRAIATAAYHGATGAAPGGTYRSPSDPDGPPPPPPPPADPWRG